jgi:choline monooxygenase
VRKTTVASAQWLASQPLATATVLPPACYTSEDFAAVDRSAVFARSWQLLARAASVGAPGDHAVGEIADVPLVIVRGDDRELRALHNVCRHRAGPLALCDGRAARALVCRYHGWTYALDGRLRGAPDMGGAKDFAIAAVRLPQARISQWQGLVFAALPDPEAEPDVNAAGASVPAFSSITAAIDPRVAALDLASYEFDRRVSYEIACNWKVYVDNYLEGYHVALVHPALERALDTNRYRTHLERWHSLQESPLQPNPAGAAVDTQHALYYFIYPNTMLNILPGRMQTNRVVPLGTQRCRVDFDYFFRADVPVEARATDRAFADQVQAEDGAICERVQRGLASGSYTPGRLNPNQESGVWHFQELLRAAYRAASASERDAAGVARSEPAS